MYFAEFIIYAGIWFIISTGVLFLVCCLRMFRGRFTRQVRRFDD